MLFRPAVLVAALLSVPALSIFADDAYHIDYHHALVGKPQEHTTFFQQPYAGSKASLIYTLSEKLILGAVNPKDGSLVWRQLLTPANNASQSFLRAGEGQDQVISAVDGQIAAWSASDGRLIWEYRFAGQVKDLEILEQEDGQQNSQAKDVVVLLDEQQPAVLRLDGTSGRAKWQFEDNSGDAPFQLSVSSTGVQYIVHHGTFLGGYKLKVISLDPLTGKKGDSYTLTSDSEISSPDSILFAGANTASPLLVWADKTYKTLKVNIVGTRNTATLSIENKDSTDIEKVVIHAPYRITSLPHFLVQYQTSTSHWAEVYHVDLRKHTIAKAYDLPKLGGKGTFTTSTTDANVYFTRISAEEVSIIASTSHGVLGRWTVAQQARAILQAVHPVHAISEAVVRSNAAQAVRTAILYSNGEWSLLRNGESSWTRPEALAGIVAATFAPLPEEQHLAQQLKLETHQNVVSAYIHRVQRHLTDLKHLPEWLQSFVRRLLASFAIISEDSTKSSNKDGFGFHKLVVALTDDNRLITLDTGAQGKVLTSFDISTQVNADNLISPVLQSMPNGQVQIIDAALSQPIAVQILTGAAHGTPGVAENTGSGTPALDATIEYTLQDGEVRAYMKHAPTASLWSFAPFKGESIVSITPRPLEDPVASIGKVLGDRRVLYKYLNPNLVLVTATSTRGNLATVYLLDSVSGNVLYTTSHSNVDTARPIPAAVSENWIAYAFTSAASANSSSSRGYQLVVAELFESSLPDDRGPLAATGNLSSLQPSSSSGNAAQPHTLSQTYSVTEEISHLAVSHTKQGITSRQLLAVLPQSNSVIGIPRSIIDPRRPVGRDPTSQEQSEGLVRYGPVIEFDPKWSLNHKREVFGIKNVITSPSQLESTSLVFAYGIDAFGTRIAPSFTFDILGKDFNKIQMSLTVAALFVGVLVVAPLVRRKTIDAQWRI